MDVPQWEALGNELVKYYYSTFDVNREQVISLYSPDALITFEDHKGQGHAAIKEIFKEKVTFGTIQHIVTKVDCQPMSDNGILILVTGRLKVDNDPPHAFSQTFVVRSQNGGFFISNDIFRLSIHNM